MEKIPKIIIQTGNEEHFVRCAEYVKSVVDACPDYEHKNFSNQGMEDFIAKEYPDLYKIFNRLPIFIQRVDFFRLVAVYHYGGIYLDLDMKMLQPFDDAFHSKECVFPLDTYITGRLLPKERYKPFIDVGQSFIVGQYAFAATKNHPFIKFLIDGIVEEIDNIEATYKNNRLYVYRTTGPDYTTKRYTEYSDKNQVTILNCFLEQKFGKYAAHKYIGTWKKSVPN